MMLIRSCSWWWCWWRRRLDHWIDH
jgi:hypothetical protein